MPDPATGTSQREHLEAASIQAERQGREIPQPPEVEIPVGYEEVWTAFWELNCQRGSDGFGPAPIRMRDLEAYSRLMMPLGPVEVRLIRRMDDAYLDEQMKASKARKGTKKAPRNG